MTDWPRAKQHQEERTGEGEVSRGWANRIRDKVSRIRRAWKAVRILFENPDDTEQVFRVVAALRGNSLFRGFERFKKTETGCRVIEGEMELLSVLRDRESLETLHPDSFGQAYLRFVRTETLSADGLVDASQEATENVQSPHMLRYITRVRDMHDLWHTLTRYGREPLGEACLLAFTYAQLKNPGVAFILVLGTRRLARGYGRGTVSALWTGYRDGKKAAWLAAQPFEALLGQSVEEVREHLSIPPPTAYWKVLERNGLR